MIKNKQQTKRRAFTFGFTESDVKRYRAAMTAAGWILKSNNWIHDSGFTIDEVKAWHGFMDSGQTPEPAGQSVLLLPMP